MKILEFLGSAWAWLNGNKTVIGGIMIAIGSFIGQLEASGLVVPFLHSAMPFLLDWGAKVAEFGAAHKVVKLLDGATAPKP